MINTAVKTQALKARTRMSFPLRSNVLNAPSLGNASNARTLSNSAALGPWPWCCWGLGVGEYGGGGTGCLAVIPPCAELVMIGICCPLGDSGLVLSGLAAAIAAATAARLAFGT